MVCIKIGWLEVAVLSTELEKMHQTFDMPQWFVYGLFMVWLRSKERHPQLSVMALRNQPFFVHMT